MDSNTKSNCKYEHQDESPPRTFKNTGFPSGLLSPTNLSGKAGSLAGSTSCENAQNMTSQAAMKATFLSLHL
ncbi:MAG: hypothetical protein ABFD50_05485 [Smithella sp.]